MSLDRQFDPKINPTERVYHLKAKVHVFRKAARIGELGGTNEYQYVVLVPSECDETTRFYMAWLPEDNDHKVECLVKLGHPIYGACRLSVHRQNYNYSRGPHLFVMSKGVEDVLVHKEGEWVNFEVEPGSHDAQDTHEVDMTDTDQQVVRL